MTVTSIQNESKLQQHPPRRHRLRKAPLLFLVLLAAGSASVQAAAPVVSNVRASQRPGTKLVDINYDVADSDSATVSISVSVSTNGGTSYSLPAASVTGAVGLGVLPGTNKKITWDAGADWPNRFSSNLRFKVTATDGTAPTGMVPIPAGWFTMGDPFGEWDANERPTHSVFVSAFCMDKYEVTYLFWTNVYRWATANGYSFDNAGSGKAANHPVQMVNWFDAAKWCNARSQRDGLTPAYYTDAALSQPYRSGQVAPYVRWDSGYRLPTEAEWEKAARGGLSGKRFPWGDSISCANANYADCIRSTQPVGSYAANGYGLYDMSGNVWEWCWDWYLGNYYASSPGIDPRGPATGLGRVHRGGSWQNDAVWVRVAERANNDCPTCTVNNLGFRSALPLGQSGATHSAESGLTTVDTRSASVGTLTGRILAGSSPLANAQVRISDTAYATNTTADGRFTLTKVLAVAGYVLNFSADGYAPRTSNSVTVTANRTNNLGDISLTVVSRPYQVVPLVPDVNPTDYTVVEEGGTAYRYYRIVASDGRTAVGGATLSLRVAGGAIIPQPTEVSTTWAGLTPGVSDSDGLVRVAILASAVGGSGSSRTFEVLESGAAQAALNFAVRVKPRQYEQVWKHKVGGGVKGKVKVVPPFVGVSAGRSGAYESEVRQSIIGTGIKGETIERRRASQLKAGVNVGAAAKIGVGKVGAEAEAGSYVGADLFSVYQFDAATSDAGANAMKLYLSLGDPLSCALGPAKGLYDFVRQAYEPQFLNSNLESAGGHLRLGQYAEAEAGFQLPLNAGGGLKIGGEISGEAEVIFGIEMTNQPSPASAFVLGVASRASGSLQIGGYFHDLEKPKGQADLGISLFGASETELLSKVWSKPGASFPYRIEVEQTGVSESGSGLAIGWERYKPEFESGGGGGKEKAVEFTERLGFDLPDTNAFARLNLATPLWGIIRNGGQGSVIKADQPAALVGSLLESALNDGAGLDYEKSTYAAERTNLGGEFPLDLAEVGLTISLEGSHERGVEAVNERGRILRFKRMPREAYPAVTTNLFPEKSVFQKEVEWANFALAPIVEALNRVVTAVTETGETVVEAGKEGTKAVVRFSEGVMSSGAQIVSSWISGPSTSGGSTAFRAAFVKGDLGHSAFLPPLGASNFVYGIGGIYRFESTNAFLGTGQLSLAYSDVEVTGLNEADLQIYRLSDTTNRWVHVGGTVDSVSNVVTVAITNLGTYAVAPPLPTGDLWLAPSTNALRADGVSQMTLTVTNLLLNTGASATQAWLFTATAVGIELLDADVETNLPGVQAVSSNAAVTLTLRAPLGGMYASVSLASVAGDAFGRMGINLADDTAPAAPTNVLARAGQSRIWVSWQTNSEPDIAGYRVYYRQGQSGPPWDGVAAVEGVPSPISASGTNALLRGLTLGTNCFVAVSAVDSTGNESPLSVPVSVATTEAPPAPPTGVAVRFGGDGTNILMWGVSEDDGYNDRDVVKYDVWRILLPSGSCEKVGEVPAGISLFSETNLTVTSPQYVRYAVTAVDSSGLSSSTNLANRVLPSGAGVDNDGDGMADDWETSYGLNPQDPSDALADADGDGLSNLQECQLGKNPTVSDELHLGPVVSFADGVFNLTIEQPLGRSVTLKASTDLVDWFTITNFIGSNATIYFQDTTATNSQRFYKAVSP